MNAPLPQQSRLAPTPSGFLHIGNVANMVLTWLLARSAGGQVLLRIDDLDADRMRPEYLEDIFKTLEWLGLDWDLGPTGIHDFQRNWSQHHRLQLYDELLSTLRQRELLFACSCSRKTLQEFHGLYPDICTYKHLDLDAADMAWRLHVPAETRIQVTDAILGAMEVNLSAISGPFVVRRRDGLPAYQVASLADDLHFGSNLIVRGMDLLPSTAMQLYLASISGNAAFAGVTFQHHQLWLDGQGNKLSKSAGAQARSLRESHTTTEVMEQLAAWLFPGSACKSLAELQHLFQTHPPVWQGLKQ